MPAVLCCAADLPCCVCTAVKWTWRACSALLCTAVQRSCLLHG